MKRLVLVVLGTAFAMVFVMLAAYRVAWAGRIEEGSIETALVPSPAKYTVLLPEGYEDSGKTYPVLLFLHGGGGDNGFLRRMARIFDEAWAQKLAPEMVVVTPDADRSFYLDYQSGKEKWETFITQELLAHVRANYRVEKDRANTWVSGISMGGMGALRMGLKHLDVFSIVIAWEPGIEPAYAWKDVKIEDKFWRADALMEERYGSPIDEVFWAANNPATIVRDNAAKVKESGIAIFIDAGTDDSYGLDRGTDFLHRALYDNGIKHEYRYVYGADHVGPTVLPRFTDGLMFINRVLIPAEETADVKAMKRMLEGQKRRAGILE